MLPCSTGAESTYHQCCHRFVHSVVLFEFQDVQVELRQPEVGILFQQLGDESHQVSFVVAVKVPLLQGRKPRVCIVITGQLNASSGLLLYHYWEMTIYHVLPILS